MVGKPRDEKNRPSSRARRASMNLKRSSFEILWARRRYSWMPSGESRSGAWRGLATAEDPDMVLLLERGRRAAADHETPEAPAIRGDEYVDRSLTLCQTDDSHTF